MKLKKTSILGMLLAVTMILTASGCLATFAANEMPDTPQLAANDNLTGETPDDALQLIWPVKNCTTVTASFTQMSHQSGEVEGDKNHIITGSFSVAHINISGPNALGQEVIAAEDGVVSTVGFDATAGKYIILEHANGFKTAYGHCDSLSVAAGETVVQGTVIATVGKTGMATGPCLAFYVYENGTAVDPMKYLK